MPIETPTYSAEIVNTAFFDKLDNGQVKEAMEASTAYIRQKLYEEGVLRRLFAPQTITADELDPQLENDQPSVKINARSLGNPTLEKHKTISKSECPTISTMSGNFERLR